MNILVLGGTRGIGLAVAKTMSELGHEVVATERNPVDAPEIKTVVSQYEMPDPLLFQSSEVIIDVVGGKPWMAEKNIALGKYYRCKYVLLSTTAVYDSLEEPNTSEMSPTRQPLFHEDEFTPINYGRWKRANEIVTSKFHSDSIVLRPGLISAPSEERMSRLVKLIKNSTPFDLSDSPDATLQILDARDIGLFIHICLTSNRSGTFNIVPDIGSQTWKSVLHSLGANLSFINWRSYEYLAARKSEVLSDPPFWMPRFGVGTGFFSVNNSEAKAIGWSARKFDESAPWYLS